MKRARVLSAVFWAAAVVGAADDGGVTPGLDASGPAALAARAADKLKRGDKEGACADARASLSQDPGNRTVQDVAQMACDKADLPTKAKYTPKLPLKRLGTDSPDGAMPGAPPEAGASAPDAKPAAPMPPAAVSKEPQWYDGGPKFEPGVVVPEKPAMADPQFEASRRLTGEAVAKLEAGDAREAIRLATEAIEVNAHNPRAFLLRGVALRSKRQCRAALSDAEAGLQLTPDDLNLLKLKAESLNCAKGYKAAVETADKVLTVDPTDPRAHALKAWALKGLGDSQGSVDELKKAAALDPIYESSLASVQALQDDPDVFFLYPGERPPEKKGKKDDAGGLGKGARIAIAAGLALVTLVGMIMGLSQWLRSRAEAPPAPAAPAREPRQSPSAVLPAFRGGVAQAGSMDSGAKLASRYEVADFIGEGTTGRVHSGFDQKVGRVVAIRRMKPELSADPAEAGRYLKEATSLALPNQPSIVGLFDAFSFEGHLFLVADYVDGKPLSRMLEASKRRPFVDGLAVASQVCQALDCAHRGKVVHADLNPANILVDKRGGVRITDFWLARQAKEALSRLGRKEASGAQAYLAPEQYKGPAVPASDIYAFGICLYEMLTGARPFRGGSLAEKEAAKFTPAQTLSPELPKGLDAVFADILRPNPDERLYGGMELLKRLQALS
ncbi:MAG: protein kinase [Elusimicrobia bacterium]|nr:protein kinase [Elusimicrobiota bacterium]